MPRHLVFAAAISLLTLAGCSNAPPMPPQSEAPATERQILVMLKESSLRHFQPGLSYGAGYRSNASASPQTRIASALAHEYRLTLVSDWSMPAIGVRCFLVEAENEASAAEVVERLAADARVESVQRVQAFHVVGHNDVYYDLQNSAKTLRLDELHKMATGKNIKVAQIDTGVDLRHPDLEGQLVEPTNFVDGSSYVAEKHGTAVAGIIVARADNGIGIVGVAPGAHLMPLRACWEQAGRDGAICTSFTLAKAIQFALLRQARILNLSLSGPHDRLLERLIDSAVEQGVAVIGAIDAGSPENFPASHPRVIAVASATIGTTSTRRVVTAPGEGVLTTVPSASWGFVSGSSFATANVTGVTALLLEMSPHLKPAQVSALLLDPAYRSATVGEATNLNACAMLAQFSDKRACTCCLPGAASRTRRPLNSPAS
ncbi:MAG: S8 family serine peptidase [Betaproteobacteria bacterium]